MLMYDNKRGMSRCCFLDVDEPGFTCDDCDMKIRGICDEQFYQKYGRFKDGSD
jgi:hypothetical protein